MGAPARAGSDGRPTYAEASRSLLRDHVLDAVGDLLREQAWVDITMAEVADRAGVSRQTLYNEFGARNELSRAYLMRETDGFLAAAEEAILANPSDPRGALRSALEGFLAAGARHPLFRAVSADEGSDELLALITTQGEPVVSLAADRLAAAIGSAWPQVDAGGIKELAETLVRLAISYAALPSGSPKATASSVTTLLAPYIEQLVDETARRAA